MSQQAISKRLLCFEAKLTALQLRLYQRSCRHRYGKALASKGKRIRLKKIDL